MANYGPIDGYWSSDSNPILLMRIAGHVAMSAHNLFCLLCPFGKFGDKICHVNEDGTFTVGELIVGTDLEPDFIRWDDGDAWVRRDGFPTGYFVGDRWSGLAKHLPPCYSDTEWVLQPLQPIYTQFALYRLSPKATPKAKSLGRPLQFVPRANIMSRGSTPSEDSDEGAAPSPPWRLSK